MMAALPAVSTDMYLPSLPDVVIDLNTTKAAAQLSLTGVLIGGGVGQLIIGPLSDRYGRRRPFMAGITLHIITSILCALAPGIVSLIALRFIQGFGNAARSEEHTSELQSRGHLVCRLLLEKKKQTHAE